MHVFMEKSQKSACLSPLHKADKHIRLLAMGSCPKRLATGNGIFIYLEQPFQLPPCAWHSPQVQKQFATGYFVQETNPNFPMALRIICTTL